MPACTPAGLALALAPSTKQILRLGFALGRSDGGRLARLAVRLERLDKLDAVVWVVELTAWAAEVVASSAELAGTLNW